MTVTAPSCAVGDYGVTFNWQNTSTPWYLDISGWSDFRAGTVVTADVSQRINKQAPSNFVPAFDFVPGQAYYWRIYYRIDAYETPTMYVPAAQGNVSGPGFTVPACGTTGSFDGTGDCTAQGWAYDPGAPTANIQVHFYRDGLAGS